jgi:hypothetical protein
MRHHGCHGCSMEYAEMSRSLRARAVENEEKWISPPANPKWKFQDSLLMLHHAYWNSRCAGDTIIASCLAAV